MSLDAAVHVVLGTLDLRVDLRVDDGEVVAVLGPNGAGKTTLLRALAGLLPLDDGHVTLDGVVLDDASDTFIPPERRPVGVVFQDYLLFPHLSALENVAFGLRCRGLGLDGARGQARQWLERVGLAQQGDSKPGQLSGGQAQRVALARALAIQPRLLLLDEPLSALDIRTRAELRRELRRHLESFRGVRLLVTHDPIEAIALADRLVILEQGHVVQEGAPAMVTEQPRSQYVADLVGVNLFRGLARDGQIEVRGGGLLTVPGADGGEVFAVIHPRAVALHRHPPEGTPRNVWRGSVDRLDREGDRVRVRVDGTPAIVAEVTAAAVSALRLDAGGEVWVSVKATEITTYPA